MTDVPRRSWTLPRVKVQMLDMPAASVASDFTLQPEPVNEGLRISIVHSPGKFSAATVRGFLHLYHALLSVVAEDEEMREIPARDLLSAAERKAHVLLNETNAISAGILRRRQGLSISIM